MQETAKQKGSSENSVYVYIAISTNQKIRNWNTR